MQHPDRAALQRLGTEMRAEHGPSVLAERLRDAIAADNVMLAVVNGVRNTAEWRVFAEPTAGRSVLLAMATSADVRFQRLRVRRRPGDPQTRADFEEVDARDRGSGRVGPELQVGALMDLADRRLTNDGSEDALAAALADLLDYLGLHAAARRVRPFVWWWPRSWLERLLLILGR